ncbi:MAG: 2-oxoglutarate dehydrogenase E1 component [Acidobacteriota bacterium]
MSSLQNAAIDPQVLDAYRRWGYLAADLDPLGRLRPLVDHPDLPRQGAGVEEARRLYCGTIGAEFMHIPDPARRAWIAERLEAAAPAVDRAHLLDRLIRAEVFEQLLQARYTGNKRFSLEGVTALVPLLEEALEAGADLGLENCVLAMSHRGRLNVMVHIVGKDPHEVFAGFEDVDPRSILGSGDVKYHLGATVEFHARNGRTISLHLASNPSHLEAVDPVALGRVRAKQDRWGEGSERRAMPILMHGDAAFAGQGIVAETLNLATIPGFGVGGTVHVVVNNLIGFTTAYPSLTASRFETDVAKRLPIPILHVNGEDPDAVVRVARLAVEYRYAFASDVVIDLIGYRRHGHSEVDDPTITQPLLYQRIKEHPPLWKLYAERAGSDPSAAQGRAQRVQEELGQAQKEAAALERIPLLRTLPSYWAPYRLGRWSPAVEVDTGLRPERLRSIAEGLARYPESFHIHPKVKKLLEQRLEMARGERPLDYGMAEALAFGSLLLEGHPVRLSGQDSRRGTFAHRHSVLIDVENESEWVPLQHLADPGGRQARFQSYDSILSEAAVLGFEYGYSRDYPEALVLWEAQFGDFANGAEIIIDQFVAAAEDKWGLLSGLVLLLPHGYEGQGPEHSSARIERYLQLAAEDNLQVCQPANAAQYFHLLRRQALRAWRKPLVVFTPKSMLRHPDAMSPLADLTLPRFLPVVPDPEVHGARRVLFCSGKIGHELRAERQRRKDTASAILFLDQLYPFPVAEVEAALAAHPEAREILWVQEEPANMGAHAYVMPLLEHHAHGRHVRAVKRSASASPATGSPKAHTLEQKTILNLAFLGA